MAKEIILSKGLIALVDDEDFDRVNQFKWSAQEGTKTFYAARNDRTSGKRIYVFLHRFIMGVVLDKDIIVDHIDGDGLNNQRSNLRIATVSDNSRNSRKRKHSKQKYKGIRERNTNRYEARIRFNRQEIYLGAFDTPEKAALAYNEAAIILHGDFANINVIDGEDNAFH